MTQNNLTPVNQSSQWLTEIYRQEYAGLMFYIGGFIKEKQQAEDILGDSMYKLFRKVQETPDVFAAPANVKNFLVTTIRNTCLKSIRDQRPHNEKELAALIADDAHAALQLEKGQILKLLQSFIDKLPERLQLVARLAWVDGYSVEEMAKSMGISKDSVSVYKNRALERLTPMIIKHKDLFSPRELFLLLSWLYATA